MPPDYNYDEFVYYWTSAVEGETPDGTPVDADLNHDNFVSMSEAFNYASTHDTRNETPQYSSTPLALGDYLSLYGLFPFLTITGSSPVCTSGSTFTLNNPPANSTVNWTHSSNLTYISGQGTDNYTVKAASSSINGMGWVKAIVNSGYGNDTLERNVWVGVPGTPSITIIPPLTEVGPNSTIEGLGLTPGAENYNWTVAGGTITSGQGTSDIWIQTVSCTPVRPVDLYIQLVAGNACGNSEKATKSIPFNCSGGPSPLSVSPNPASQTLNVELTDTTSTTTNQATNEAYTVQLFNPYNKLVYERKGNMKRFSINVSKYRPGVYYLRLIKGNHVYSKKIIIVTY